eukprot:12688081-Heterocapsa_arctica.AAC.1
MVMKSVYTAESSSYGDDRVSAVPVSILKQTTGTTATKEDKTKANDKHLARLTPPVLPGGPGSADGTKVRTARVPSGSVDCIPAVPALVHTTNVPAVPRAKSKAVQWATTNTEAKVAREAQPKAAPKARAK